MERVFENIVKYKVEGNIKLTLFFHLVKVIYFRQLMVSLANETENNF